METIQHVIRQRRVPRMISPSSAFPCQVEVCIPPKNCCTITFSFRRNPYFRNPVITKAYDITITGKKLLFRRYKGWVNNIVSLILSLSAGYLLSQTTPIQWFGDCECQAYRCSRQNTSMNFFNWISDHSPSGSSTIAEVNPPGAVS